MLHKATYKDTMYVCFIGYVVQAVLVNLPPLFFVTFQDFFGASFEQIGRLVLINFCTQIVTDLAAVRWADRIGYRAGLVIAHLCSLAGLLMMCLLPQLLFAVGGSRAAYAGLVVSTMVFAVGGGLIEVLISPLIEALPSDERLSGGMKSAAMSLLHSFYCWGQLSVCLLTTLLLQLVGTRYWWIFPLCWAMLPLFNLMYLLRVPIPKMQATEEGGSLSLRQLFSSGLFWIAMILMMAAGASELSMSQWASLFAEKALGVSKVVGDLLGPCLFALFMGLGRAAYARMGERIRLDHGLMSCALLCICCYSLTVFVHLPVFSFAGCALCGLSVSLMWPGTLSLTARRFPTGGTAMFGMLAVCGDIGCSIGPWVTGLVSDAVSQLPGADAWGGEWGLNAEQLGLKAGLGVAIVFPLMMLVGVLLLRSRKEKV